MEENIGMAQKERKRVARGVHGQVSKKISGWHRKKKKGRHEVHMRNCLRKRRGTKSKRRRRKSGKRCTRASVEENIGVAQKKEERAARGAHEESSKKTWMDKEQTKKKEKEKEKKKRKEEHGQVKKTLRWHRRKEKERQEVYTRYCLRKRGGKKSKQKKTARGAYGELSNKTWRVEGQRANEGEEEKKWQEVQQVWKKTLRWHRRKEKERQEVYTRYCLRKRGGTKSKKKRAARGAYGVLSKKTWRDKEQTKKKKKKNGRRFSKCGRKLWGGTEGRKKSGKVHPRNRLRKLGGTKSKRRRRRRRRRSGKRNTGK